MTATTTTPSVRRLQSGRRRRWRKRSRAVIVVVALVAVVGGGAYVALGTDLLAVKSVDVTGTHVVATSAVLTAAQVPVGTPMVRLDGAAVRSRILAGARGIASVSVVRDWPSTVRLVVTERTAVAAVPQDGKYVLVDRSGVAYRTVDTVPTGLAVLNVSTPDTDDGATRAGLSVLLSLPPEVRALLARIEAPTAEQVVLFLRDKRQIVWGNSADAAAKGAVVKALLRRPGKVIDVSSPGLATVR